MRTHLKAAKMLLYIADDELLKADLMMHPGVSEALR